MSLDAIYALVKDELAAVDQLIAKHLTAKVPLTQEIAEYIVRAGGKRIRPLLVLLGAKAFGYHKQDHLILATIIELLHTATLLHDDVIDHAKIRRGRKTANMIWGNQASVLAGDFLHARCFEIMTTLENKAVIELLADATSIIIEGELLQLTHCHDPSTNEETYLNIIEYKTGKLFEVAASVGTILSNYDKKFYHAMANYGRNLGAAFQLIDDILDYDGNQQQLGKSLGNDLAEGKPTLPLIYVWHHGNTQQKKLIKNALQQYATANITAIKEVITTTGALEYTKKLAKTFANRAKSSLCLIPPSLYRDGLYAIVELAINRQR